ncbi:MAG: PAS domain S-box protein, partial [Holophaga sp.]|nr:PAS domain S-box protein [Holophaga sp.]
MSLRATYKTVASLFGAVLLAFLVVVASFGALRQIQEASAARKQSHHVLDAARELMVDLVNAETGQRGFLLTGDEAFLEPYLAVRDGIPTRMEKLQKMSVSRLIQEQLNLLSPRIDLKMSYLARNIDLRRNQNSAAALVNMRGAQGLPLMDSIRSGLSEILRIEELQLARHEGEFQANMHTMFTVIIIISLLSLLCALAFTFFIYRGTQQQLKDMIHFETRHLLLAQEETNKQLQLANANLQRSEENLAVTLDSIGDAVIATDAQARVTRLNPIAVELTGWAESEAIGHRIDEIFHIINQKTRELATIPVMETLARGTIMGLANDTVLIARDGRECAIADSCAPIRDRDGKVVGAVLVFHNVTEEYAAQQALRDSAALVQTILNTVVDGIITFQADEGLVDSVNPAVQRMFGYSAEEIIGQDFSILIPELDGDPHKTTLSFYSPGKEASAKGLGREVTGRRKDGSRFPMEMAVSEMWLGGHRSFTGILRDITFRKDAEEALKKAGALQNAIFNSANFSSIATDAKGVIQIFNVGAERMLGYTAAEVMNKITPADISDPLEIVERAEALSLELSTPIAPGFEALVFKAYRGIEDIYELTYIRKDGSRFPAVVSVTGLRDDQGAIIGYLLIGTDNTARKRAEEDLVKAGALQT